MEKIKHYFKKSFRRTDFSGLSLLSRGQQFDWEILLTLFLLIVVIIVSFSVHVFIGVRAGDIFQSDYVAPSHNTTIDRNMLDQTIKNFADRADTLKNLQAQKPVFIDPSL